MQKSLVKVILETTQLILAELSIEDTAFIIELVNTPGWIKYIGDRNVKNEQQAIAYLENGPLKSYTDNGYGLWKVLLKAEQKAIGMCGIINRENLDHPDIGFAFLPAYSGRGYAFEAASSALKFATDKLKLSTILAITLPSNERSKRLLEKIGLVFIKQFSFPESEELLMLYSTNPG
jgi:RimJ/RimL family protein N-acetyltransferase